MTGQPCEQLANVVKQLSASDLTCYCPCAGRDVALALAWLGSSFDRFVFCDIGYRREHMTGRGAVLEDWERVSVVPEERRRSNGRPDRSSIPEVIETWHRPDGSPVVLEFRAEPAEVCLTTRFAAGTISALMHINDGTCEGGSDLWFLGTPGMCRTEPSRCFLPDVAKRLSTEALVITDQVMTDREFAEHRLFHSSGRRWERLFSLENSRVRDRTPVVWRTVVEREM